MPDEISLDFSSVRTSRRKRRSKRDITRYWYTRYDAFIRDGFLPEEAEWGADHGLSLRDHRVKLLRRHRRALIAWYRSKFGWTRMRAMQEAAGDLKAKLEAARETELILYFEVSP